MSTREATTPLSTSRGTRALLWFGLLGGGLAWTLHLILSYLTAEFGCEAGLDSHVWMGVMLPAWILIGVSLVMTLLSAWATLVAWRLMRRFAPAPGAGEPVEPGPDAYLARAGFQTSALFTAIIVVQSLPVVYYLGSC